MANSTFATDNVKGLIDRAKAKLQEALALHQQGHWAQAKAIYRSVLQAHPRHFDALHWLDVLAHQTKDHVNAVGLMRQAIAINPDTAAVYSNLGVALQALNRFDEALACYDQAIQLGDDAAARCNRGSLLVNLGKFEDAVETFSRLLETAPAYPFAQGHLLHTKMLCCDWTGLPELADAIKQGIAARKKSAEPFGYQGISCSEQDLRACAEIYAADKFPMPNITLCKTTARRPGKIRIGYLAGEFREQATAVLMTGVWEQHDKSRHYTEKIVYLPHSYQPNDRKRQADHQAFSREALGLPRAGFVFCCFNNNYKITPGTFAVWMRILNRVDGSLLWLLEDNPTAAINLRHEAAARGVSADRLIFAKRVSLPAHLARHRAADLFLDTPPYNAHTTASDALWTGLPVLTCVGATFAGRVAASLLNAMALPELITRDEAQYESLAVELAADADKLSRIKHKLERNRLTTPLFDTALFTRHIEAAYTQMVERSQADLPPAHMAVEE